jgi:sec-independent protein translocase protein TatC
MFFAHKVVRILIEPLEESLKSAHLTRIGKLGDEYIAEQLALPTDKRERVALDLSLPSDQAAELAKGLRTELFPGKPNPVASKPPAEEDVNAEAKASVKFKVEVEAQNLVAGLNAPLAMATKPWSVRTLAAQEAFVMFFKAALGSAFILACPWVFYQLYSFVAVGLYAHERRFVHMTIPFSVGLFLTGVAFCYFVMLPLMVRFLLSANEWMGLQPDIRLNEWVGFCVLLMLIFGATFQLPLLMLTLEKVGIVTYEGLASKRKISFFLIFVFAAVVTPTPDPFNQAVLAIPMYGLFEIGLLLMRRFQQRSPISVDAPLARV